MASHPARDFWPVIGSEDNPILPLPPPAESPVTAPQTQPATPVNRAAVATNNQLSLTESDWFGATPRVLENYFWNTNSIASTATTPLTRLPFSSQDDPFLDTLPNLSTPAFQSPSPTETWDSQTDQSPFSLAPETPTYQSKPESKFFWERASFLIREQPDPFAFVLSSITSAKSDDSFPELEGTSSSPPSGPPGLELGNSSSSNPTPSFDNPVPQSSSPPSSRRQSRPQTLYFESHSTRTRKTKSSPHRSLSSVRECPRRGPRREETDPSPVSSASNWSSQHSTHSNDSDYTYSPLPTLVVKLPVPAAYLTSLQTTGRLVPLPIRFVEAKRVSPEPEVYTHPRAIKSPWRDPSYAETSEANMAPSYRASNRRQNRAGYNEHDVFDGLPVRHWKRELTTVAPPPDQESTKPQNDIWDVELPHGMPKDSHLLPQHSQDLLRAARSGKIWKRPAPTEEEEIDPEISEKQEKKEDDGKDKAFSARAWKQIPRNQEGPDVEYLAKRRKGLITYTKPLPAVPTVTKTTVRRTDAAGNEYNQEVIVPHGQQVDGEVISQVVIPDPSAVQQVAPLAPQPTPPRRKTPVVKKKPKAVRGRKKKVVAPTSAPPLAPANGPIIPGGPVSGAEVVGSALVMTGTEAVATPATTEDTVMGEGSIAASDDEEGDEDGDEGDDDDESVGDQNSPSKVPRTTASPSPMSLSLPTMKTIPDIAPPNVGPPGLAFAPHLEREKSEGKSGSPLKNVALSTSAVATPLTSPIVTGPPQPFPEIATVETLPPQTQDSIEAPKQELAAIDDVMDIDTIELAPTLLPPPPPDPNTPEIQIAEEVRKEEEEEEEMLLDIVENASNADIGQAEPLPIAVPEVAAQIDILLEELPAVPVSGQPTPQDPTAIVEDPEPVQHISEQPTPQDPTAIVEDPEPVQHISEQPTPQDPTAIVEDPEPVQHISEPEKIATPVEKVPTPIEAPLEVPVEVPIQPTELPKTPDVVSAVEAEILPFLPEQKAEEVLPELEVVAEAEVVHEEESDLPDTQVLPQSDTLPDPKDDIKDDIKDDTKDNTEDDIEDDSDDFPDLLGGLEKSLGQPPPAKVEEPVQTVPEVVAEQIIVNNKEEKANNEVDPSAGSA